MKGLVLISCPEQEDQGTRSRKFAEWMGVPARTVSVEREGTLERLAHQLGPGLCTAAISADTLSLLLRLGSPDALQRLIETQFARLLVFSVGDAREHLQIYRWLTDGTVASLTSAEKRQTFHFPEGGRRLSSVFTGQSFAIEHGAPISTFDVSSARDGNLEPILLADERPVFLRTQRGPCEVFLLTMGRLAGIDEPLSERRGIEDYYDQVIPLLIFLRHCFGEKCWHGIQSTGRLIIDDPLLVQEYGCLSFGALRNSMRSAGYGTSIAFIPWNHWRTSKTKAAKVIDGSPDLSICVHGCDHMNREFEDLDPGSLQWKADTALLRMERHKSRTGLAFDPVMVPPQGKFSSPAIAAFRASGYLAAVNSTCFPTNDEAASLTVGDFLRPAITKFCGFPLFQRRYPRRLMDFAFDIFVGRPVLIVQHHDDFRDGYGQLEEFVAGLYQLEPALTWGPLAGQLMQTCMVRSLEEGSMEVRFFTSQFKFRNSQSRPVTLTFTKEEPDASAISVVLVNGTRVPCSLENGLLTFEYQATAGQAIDVTVLDKPRKSAPACTRRGPAHTAGVFLRRALSEFRDSTLVKYPLLLKAATALALRMRATGDSAR